MYQSNAGWIAINYSEQFKLSKMRNYALGTKRENKILRKLRRPTLTHDDVNIKIPSNFDARMNWSYCPSIQTIQDQSNCGSCWVSLTNIC
ncbi:unnamed protein product [Schistosoma turkestanicum]|nr:unnamed protein product [Schistosoma turkestanicum]